MKLDKKDYEFNNTRICQVMPKHLELDRIMINLYLLLKYNGHRPVTRGRAIQVTVDEIYRRLVAAHGDRLPGFADHPDVAQEWIYSDLVDVVFRGVPEKEKVAAPVPLHLNAYKLRNAAQVADYRGSEHLFSMIYHADPSLIGVLADFLGSGMVSGSYDTYDPSARLDMYTLAVVRMVDTPDLQERPSSDATVLDAPLCMGQARLLSDDLRRLLAYGTVLPRPVMVGYLRTLFGLHLGLYLLRLFHQLPGWLEQRAAHPACLNCPVRPGGNPFQPCPYAHQNPESELALALPELIVDAGDDYTSRMAVLAQESCTRHYAQIGDYTRSVFIVNQVARFAASSRARRELGHASLNIADLIDLYATRPAGMEDFFADQIDRILPGEELADERPDVRAVYEMERLSSFDRFIELVSLERTRYYRKYLTEQLDSVFMKNQDTGLLHQGKGKRNQRRWYLGSRMLEMLVQLALLEPAGPNAFRSRPILIDDFLNWLHGRYGLVLVPDRDDAGIQDYQAFNSNLRALKTRLREIGFYSDLSDAYNTQRIRPRYQVEPS